MVADSDKQWDITSKLASDMDKLIPGREPPARVAEIAEQVHKRCAGCHLFSDQRWEQLASRAVLTKGDGGIGTRSARVGSAARKPPKPDLDPNGRA